jgi:hypothetical protein
MATVHFQQGLSLAQLLPYYGTEAEGYSALYNMIEPEAPRRLEKRDGMPPGKQFCSGVETDVDREYPRYAVFWNRYPCRQCPADRLVRAPVRAGCRGV